MEMLSVSSAASCFLCWKGVSELQLHITSHPPQCWVIYYTLVFLITTLPSGVIAKDNYELLIHLQLICRAVPVHVCFPLEMQVYY